MAGLARIEDAARADGEEALDHVARRKLKLSPECVCGGPKYIGAEMCQPCRVIERRTHPTKAKRRAAAVLRPVPPVTEDESAKITHCPHDRLHRLVERVSGVWCPTCQGFVYRRSLIDGELVLAIWRPRP